MVRPTKTGLDYFPFDIDFFDDEKIIAIAGEFGIKGEITAVKQQQCNNNTEALRSHCNHKI